MPEAIATALDELPRLGLAAQSGRALRLTWERFGSYLEDGVRVRAVAGVDRSVIAGFVRARRSNGSAPSVGAMHWRRSALRILYRVWRDLDLVTGDATLDLRLPAKTTLSARPLTDEEVALCRWASLATATATRLPAIWALAEVGAISAEIPVVRVCDVDLACGTVSLAGGTHTEPREATLTAWGRAQIRRRLDQVGPNDAARLAYEGAGRPESMQASVSGAVGDILRRAGLADEADVRPRSVTAWAGRQVFAEAGRIEDVAQRLGLRSLDRAAALIGWDWRT